MVKVGIRNGVRCGAALAFAGSVVLTGLSAHAAPPSRPKANSGAAKTPTAPAKTAPNTTAPAIELLIQDPPSHGLIAAHLDLTAAARQSKALPVIPEAFQALSNGQPIPVQFVPDPDFDDQERIAGTLLLRYPRSTNGRVRLMLGSRATTDNDGQIWDGTVKTPHVVVTHDARRLGGFPSQLRFTATDKLLQGFGWNDRLYHRELGRFDLRHDPQARVRRIATGELCTVVRTRGHFTTAEGKRPASEPTATYDWYYFHSLPLVWVRATISQREETAWHEHHFLELDSRGEGFSGWAGGDAVRQGEFTASRKVHAFPGWGALLDGKNAIGMLASGQVLIYDGGKESTYLHAFGDMAWQGWGQKERQFSAWLWLATDNDPVAAVRATMGQLPVDGKISLSSTTARADQ
jgi:hypothetical protein